jgi:hypothetical protein
MYSSADAVLRQLAAGSLLSDSVDGMTGPFAQSLVCGHQVGNLLACTCCSSMLPGVAVAFVPSLFALVQHDRACLLACWFGVLTTGVLRALLFRSMRVWGHRVCGWGSVDARRLSQPLCPPLAAACVCIRHQLYRLVYA